MRSTLLPISLCVTLLSVSAMASTPNINKRFECEFGTDHETLDVDVHAVNFQNDKKKPPLWGSISDVKVTINGQKIDANPIDEEQQRIAVVTKGASSSISAQKMTLYEIDISSGRIRRTYFRIFTGAPAFFEASEATCKASVRPSK